MDGCPEPGVGAFWPLLTGAEGTVILTGVTVLVRGRTLLFAAFGRCLGAIDVSVGPTESVILAFVKLFLAATSLAVRGSGSDVGMGELKRFGTGQSFPANLKAK